MSSTLTDFSSPKSLNPASTSTPVLISYPASTPPPTALPAAPPPPPQVLKDRLYVGNLHPTVDEYTLLQLFSKYGKVSKLDFLFHKSGPARGKPRGYAFVEYAAKEDALHALVGAHDRLIRGRRLVVTFAHQAPALDPSRPARRPGTDTSRPTTLSLLKTQNRPEATKDKIAALEAKLRQMEAQKSVQTKTNHDLMAEDETREAETQKHIDSKEIMDTQTPASTLRDLPPYMNTNPAHLSSLPPLPPSTPQATLPPALLSSLPAPSLSSRTPNSTPPPLTMFPSSLPSRPLLTTLPTISPSGAQSIMPADRKVQRKVGLGGNIGGLIGSGSGMGIETVSNLRAKLSRPDSAGSSRQQSATSNRAPSRTSITQIQGKSSTATSTSRSPSTPTSLSSKPGSRSGSIPRQTSSSGHRQTRSSLGIVMKR